MSELGTAFYQFALAQMTTQASMRNGVEAYALALEGLEHCSEKLAEAMAKPLAEAILDTEVDFTGYRLETKQPPEGG